MIYELWCGTRTDRVGNDGLYGGLGGEFTVITASEINGPLVLRHELGHTLIDEGDEYDGSKLHRPLSGAQASWDEMTDQSGFAYYGPNAAKIGNLEKGIKWGKFLSKPGDLRIEDSTMPLQDYPQVLLHYMTRWSMPNG